MKPVPHIVASGIISILSIAYFRSFGYAAVSFLAGFLIDADHIIDYYLNREFTFNIKKIYHSCLVMDLKRVYLVLHSYELIAFLWTVIYIFSLSKLWQAITLGLTQHIILDQITNPICAFGYFFLYRVKVRFNKDMIIKTIKG